MKIENNIPIPTRIGPYKSQLTIALFEMKPGQSFLVPTKNQRNSAFHSAKLIGCTVVTQKQNGTGYRIWKTSDRPAKRKVGKPKNLPHEPQKSGPTDTA